MIPTMIRHSVLPLVAAALAVVLAAPPARAGVYPTVCDRAELTVDGRYVLLRPGCRVDGAVELATGALLGAAAAKKIAAVADVMPLLPLPATDAYSTWMTKAWTDERKGSWEYRWLAFPIPGTDFVLRVLRKAGCTDGSDGSIDDCPDASLTKEVQYAPSRAFQDAFSQHKRGPANATTLPKVGPFGAAPLADLTDVFVVGLLERRPRSIAPTFGRSVTYDPAAFVRLVPTFGDFVRHARYQWRHIGSERTSGWRIDAMPPKSFWAALGYAKPGFRIIVPADDSRANAELHRIYDALSHGRPFSCVTYVPSVATALDFAPK